MRTLLAYVMDGGLHYAVRSSGKSAKPALPTLNNFKWNKINICLQRTTHVDMLAHFHFCRARFIETVLYGSFEYTQHILKTIFFYAFWWGGQVKKIQIFRFQWRSHVWSHSCEHVFSVCHKLKLSVLFMLLWNFKKGKAIQTGSGSAVGSESLQIPGSLVRWTDRLDVTIYVSVDWDILNTTTTSTKKRPYEIKRRLRAPGLRSANPQGERGILWCFHTYVG